MSGEANAATCTSVLTGKSPVKTSRRAPDLLAVLDVGDEDHDLDDIGHGAARRLDQAAYLDEDVLGLIVLVARRLPVLAARDHAGDVCDTVHHQAVRPGARSGLGRRRAGYARDAGLALCCHASFLPMPDDGCILAYNS